MGIMLVQIWKNSPVGWMKIVVLGLGWGQFAHIMFGMADSIPLGAKTGVFFWLSLALITVIYNFMREQSQNLEQLHYNL
jgi:hypothetical protein